MHGVIVDRRHHCHLWCDSRLVVIVRDICQNNRYVTLIDHGDFVAYVCRAPKSVVIVVPVFVLLCQALARDKAERYVGRVVRSVDCDPRGVTLIILGCDLNRTNVVGETIRVGA